MRVKHSALFVLLLPTALYYFVLPKEAVVSENRQQQQQQYQQQHQQQQKQQQQREETSEVPLYSVNGERVFKRLKGPVDCNGSPSFCKSMQVEAQAEIDAQAAKYRGMQWQQFQELEIAAALQSAQIQGSCESINSASMESDVTVAIKYSYSDVSRKRKVRNFVQSVRRWHARICIIVLDDYTGSGSVPDGIMDYAPNLMYVKMENTVGLSMGRNLLVHLTKVYIRLFDDEHTLPM